MTAEIFESVDHGRTSDEVVSQVERLLVEGILRVGDRLPGERALSRQLDVSRPILREALKELERRGLIVSHAGGGTYVADIVGSVFSEPLVDLISRHGKAARDYLDYRREVEAMTARMAARRATPADRALIGEIADAMRKAHAAVDFERESALDVELHSAVGECAHNIVLLHTLRACYRLLSDGVFYNRTLIYHLDGARDALLTQHVAIAEAIIGGDEAGAEAAARAHIDFVAAAIIRAEQSGDWARIADLRLRRRAIIADNTLAGGMAGTPKLEAGTAR